MALIRIKNGYAIVRVEQLFDEGAPVGRWYREQSGLLTESLKDFAPVLTGRLRRSIRVDQRRAAPVRRTITVRFGAKYARYTDKGTYGPIVSRSGKLMPVGKSQGVSGRRIPASEFRRRAVGEKPRAAFYPLRREVRGQAGTNWVSNGVRAVPAFRGYRA